MIPQNLMNTDNPLLKRVQLPGETHKLPSGGVFYTNGELTDDVVDGEVHVYPMSALDEILVRSPDKLFSGEAIVEVFKRCIPQVLKPKELLQKDVDFLMVILRKVSYGPEFEIEYTHTCDSAKAHKYMIDMSVFIRNAKTLDPTTVQSKFQTTLENGQVVKIHPIKFGDIIEMMQDMMAIENNNDVIELKQSSLKTLISVIESVDDVTDKKLIQEWIENIPVSWTNKITEMIDAASDWGPEFTTTVTCKDCQQPAEVNVPINPLSFFL